MFNTRSLGKISHGIIRRYDDHPCTVLLTFFAPGCPELPGGAVRPYAAPERKHAGAELPYSLPSPAHLLLPLETNLLDGRTGGGLQVSYIDISH